MADYTKHAEGRYQVRVINHEIGESNGDDYLQLNLQVVGRITGDGVDESAGGKHVKSSVKLTPDKMWLVVKTLKALGYHGSSLQPIFDDTQMFAGVEMPMDCSHSVNTRNGNKNEYFNLPRDGALLPMREGKASLYDSLFAETVAKLQPVEGEDDGVPY